MHYKNVKDIFNSNMLEGKKARGDKVLWEEFAKYYSNYEFEYNKDKFKEEFSNIFKNITGKELLKNKIYYIKKFDLGYGLSSGEIYTNYWIDTVLPYIFNTLK